MSSRLVEVRGARCAATRSNGLAVGSPGGRGRPAGLRQHDLLASLDDDLKFVFITSQAQAVQVASDAEEAIAVTASAAPKCERCWHYRQDVGSHAEHSTLCGRCVSNLFGSGEQRAFA